MKITGRTFFEGTPLDIIDYTPGKDEQGCEWLTLYTREQAIVVHYIFPTPHWPGDIPQSIFRHPTAEAMNRETNAHGFNPVGPNDYPPFPSDGQAGDSFVWIEAPRPLTRAEKMKLATALNSETMNLSTAQLNEKEGRLILFRDGKECGNLKADTIPAAVMRTLFEAEAPLSLDELCKRTGANNELRRQTFKRHKAIFDGFIRIEPDRTKKTIVKYVSLRR